MAYPALLIATAVPLLFLYLVHTLDLYGSGAPRAVTVSFSWGAASVFIVLLVYRLLREQAGIRNEVSLTLYAAPIVEETTKALVLLYLIRRPTFTYFVDGAIYGFAAGIGFAVFENYLYIFQNVDTGVGTALGRVLSTNLMHASAGAIVGISLGVSRFRRFRNRALYLLAGLFLAILLHAAFNRLVADSEERQLFLYAVGVGLCGVAFTAIAIRRGLAIERAWISESLGMGNRITSSEITAARRLDQVESMLMPLRTIFGRKKAAQIEELLLLQAQLGILRKMRERSRHHARSMQDLAQQIDHKQEKMESLRRDIGAYTMASLRILFPLEGSPLWQHLEQELSVRRQTGQSQHENLFALLESRSQQQNQVSEADE